MLLGMVSLFKAAARNALPRQAYFWLGLQLFPRFCPVCTQGFVNFVPFGDPVRPEAMCPSCGSLERHRMIWLFFKRRTNLFDATSKRILHIAPEPSLGPLIAGIKGVEYTSGDFKPGRAMVQMDITRIEYPDDTFDVIYCSHVLEHVLEDRQAMREFHRVLKPGGWAVLQVPVTVDVTFEDPTVTDPAERKRLFGQDDHVRRYGPDYCDRLVEAGFTVQIIPCTSQFSEREIRKYGLDRTENVYLCRKTGNAKA